MTAPAAPVAADARDRCVPTYCYQCVAGPDLLTVRVQDGVATEVDPNSAPPTYTPEAATSA